MMQAWRELGQVGRATIDRNSCTAAFWRRVKELREQEGGEEQSHEQMTLNAKTVDNFIREANRANLAEAVRQSRADHFALCSTCGDLINQRGGCECTRSRADGRAHPDADRPYPAMQIGGSSSSGSGNIHSISEPQR